MSLYSTTLSTERLNLHLADADSEDDVSKIIRTYNDPFIGPWGLAKIAMNTRLDVVSKFQRDGPKPRHCTLLPAGTPPPSSSIHLVHLKSTGEYIGMVGISFRDEMPFPDLGYAFFEPFNGHGYASEAGRAVVKFWIEQLGVKDIFVGTFDTNVRSQRCAVRIGFIEGGTIGIAFEDGSVVKGRAFILPGMTWPDGEFQVRASVGKLTESKENDRAAVY